MLLRISIVNKLPESQESFNDYKHFTAIEIKH